MNIDVTYQSIEDRIRLTVRNEHARVDWWLTRRFVMQLLPAWLKQIEHVALPQVPFLPPVPRNVAQEHALSLEFDGPRQHRPAAAEAVTPLLTNEISLKVAAATCDLVIRHPSAQTEIQLTRKEAHAVLELLAQQARHAGWLSVPAGDAWPTWLGQSTWQDQDRST